MKSGSATSCVRIDEKKKRSVVSAWSCFDVEWILCRKVRVDEILITETSREKQGENKGLVCSSPH